MQLSGHTGKSDGLTQSGVPAFKLISDELDQVRELVSEQLAGCPDKIGISRLVEYLNPRGGKMIRPGLVLLSYRVPSATLLRFHPGQVRTSVRAPLDANDVGGKPSNAEKHLTGRDASREQERQDKAVRIAAVVEMIHNAALLHDDVIDEGQKRRGLPTVNSLWGNESAVLLGDFLLSRVFEMCADLEPRFQKIIAAATCRTCEGELRQIIQRQNLSDDSQDWQLSESEYIDIITEKTAALFSSCCHLGALLGGASETEVQLLSDFGLNTGIGFQITDDLLDIIGDENKMGKTLGSDVGKNKPTLAVIHLLGVVDEKEKSVVMSKLNAGVEGKKALVEMLRSYGSLDYACGRVQEFVAKAIAALAGLKENSAKDALIGTVRFVEQRVV